MGMTLDTKDSKALPIWAAPADTQALCVLVSVASETALKVLRSYANVLVELPCLYVALFVCLLFGFIVCLVVGIWVNPVRSCRYSQVGSRRATWP